MIKHFCLLFDWKSVFGITLQFFSGTAFAPLQGVCVNSFSWSFVLFFFNGEFLFYIHIFLLMAGPSLHCCLWAFSTCGGQGPLSRCGMQVSHCGDIPCWGAQAVSHTGSVVVGHRLSSPVVCGIFPDQGSNPHSPALAGGLFVTTGPQGK